MNDRMTIAARMMAARVQSVQWAQADRDMLARHVVKDADALLKALAESEAEHAPNWHDEVGDWRKYVWPDGMAAVAPVSAGNMAYVDKAFWWRRTPQGFEFWRAIADGNASALTITRARDFARRVLEAMEAEGE